MIARRVPGLFRSGPAGAEAEHPLHFDAVPAEEIDDAVEAIEIETFRRRLNLAPINAGPQIPHAEPGGRLRFEFLLPRRPAVRVRTHAECKVALPRPVGRELRQNGETGFAALRIPAGTNRPVDRPVAVQRQLLRNVEHRAFAGRERLLPPERKGGAVKSGQFSFEDERQRPIRAIGHPNPHRIAGREQREARREIEPDLERSGRSGFGEKRGIVKRQVDAAAVGNQLDAFELHRALPVKSDPAEVVARDKRNDLRLECGAVGGAEQPDTCLAGRMERAADRRAGGRAVKDQRKFTFAQNDVPGVSPDPHARLRRFGRPLAGIERIVVKLIPVEAEPRELRRNGRTDSRQKAEQKSEKAHNEIPFRVNTDRVPTPPSAG